MGCQLVPKPNGSACNDGNVCTGADACDAGVCIGSAGPLVYFSEDFSDNGAGWSLDPEWQIGSATGSMGHNFGNPDPAQDHSPGNNNGVAGVTLGGNVAISMSHDFYWLTSPPFNATIDPGPVLLSFRRWLNSDWMPWMNNRVEVFNGASWITIWESGNQPVTDTGWTLVEHDLSAHKNAAMRVRFGFSVGQLSGIFTVSGWNIDDVALAVATCP
jgi:hypothetical protein